MKTTRIVLLIATALGLAACATAQTREVDIGVRGKEQSIRIVFSDHDRNLIRDYYSTRAKHVPPGLAKKGKIPPGHAMQIERWGKLPPGIASRPLPDDLERRLSALPEGYARIAIGADIGILDTRTRVIVDLIKDIASDD